MSDDRKLFKGGELKVTMKFSGYDMADLEACAEKQPELVAEILAASGDITVSDPKFAERFPRVAKLLAEKAKAK